MKRSNRYLVHYASQYYDPVKAHEYYMQHRKLKGRQRSALNDEGKQVWDATKANIKTEKDQKVEEEKKNRDTQIEQHRAAAKETGERIREKLKNLNDILSQKEKTERQNRSNSLKQKIEAIQSKPIPKNLSTEEKAKLRQARKETIAKLRGESAEETEKSRADYKSQKEGNSSSASEERKKVASDLKDVLNATREAYKSAKEGLDKNYEEIYQSEYDKILAEYLNKGKRSSKKREKQSSSTSTNKGNTNFKSLADTVKEKHARK